MRQFVTKPSLIAVSAIAIVAFVGGGIAHAASSSGTIKVCVTSKSVVRSADAKGKCPKKTKAVAVNKVGPAGPSGPRGATGPVGVPGATGAGAATRAVGSDAPTEVSYPAFARVDSEVSPTSFQVSKVSFDAPKAGFYSVAAYSEISGDDFNSSPAELGCSAYPASNTDGVEVRIDGRDFQGGISSSSPSFTDSTWLAAGAHTFELRFFQFGCLSDEFFGAYSFTNTHMQVYAD